LAHSEGFVGDWLIAFLNSLHFLVRFLRHSSYIGLFLPHKSSLSSFSLSIPCFLSFEKETNPEYNAVVRLWKIKESQLEDLQKQEGKEWYGKIITLGEKDGLKILTLSALSIWMFLKKD
jgi:hypothetical protein